MLEVPQRIWFSVLASMFAQKDPPLSYQQKASLIDQLQAKVDEINLEIIPNDYKTHAKVPAEGRFLHAKI